MKQLTSRLSRRTMAVGALALTVVVIALFVLTAGGDGEQASAQDGGVPTVALERRNLAEQISVDGTLGYGDESAVVNRLSGTITWLPEEGAEINRGRRLFDVDDEPVTLMYGDVPAYRELSLGVSDGPDVKQLESNLAELGFDADGSMTVDSEYTSATSDAVSDWQESLGLDETGSVELGRVIFQAGERRVGSLDVELGASADSASGAGASAGGTGASTTSQEADAVFASYTARAVVEEVAPAQTETVEPAEPTDEPSNGDNGGKKPATGGSGKGQGKAPQGTAGQGSQQQPEQPEAAAQPAPSGGSASSAGAASSGSSAETETSPSTQVMTTSAVSRAVTVQLDPEQVGVARRGGAVGVTLPGGKEVKGRIASVGTVAAAATDSSEQSTEGLATETATIEVTISLPGGQAAGALDEAPVTVDFTQEVQKDVFAVPVSALIGTAGDEYAIVVRDGAESRQVVVEPGLFADGYVEVEGEGVQEGIEVEVPEE